MDWPLNINTPPGGTVIQGNTQITAALAYALVDALPEEVREPIGDTGAYYIARDAVPHLAEMLQEIVAYTVASIIDAGSERDAVMENGTLAQALEDELRGWAP